VQSADLRQALLENLGLVVVAEAHLNSFTEHYGTTAQLEDDLNSERLPSTMEVIFYRLMQETLTNVRKHANATSVWVKVSLHDNVLRMSSTDNGRGFDPSHAVTTALSSGHIGLHSMQERVEVIRGGMDIDSTHGQGTCVTFWAPLQ
jgi:two-component system, NarL family, sensor histidine kinase DegS